MNPTTPANGRKNGTRVRTGIAGLDDVLTRGFPQGHLYLIEGDPGTGKTTLGLQFLLEGLKNGEKRSYVSLAEPKRELGAVAYSHGGSRDQLDIYEMAPVDEEITP